MSLSRRLKQWFHVGAARPVHHPIDSGHVVPTTRSLPDNPSSTTEEVIDGWASQQLPVWEDAWKVKAPRVCLAKLVHDHLPMVVNSYLLQQRPHRQMGSSWPLHPNGDYDFTVSALIPLLFLASRRLSYRATEHIVNTLIPLERDNTQTRVPRTLGIVEDTENHVLNIEGSRYLKYLWLHKRRGDTGPADGPTRCLTEFLEEMWDCGIWEFNSDPYEAYTMCALMNLASFGEGRIQELATRILDRLNWQFALGVHDDRQLPPFRRKPSRDSKPSTHLGGHYHADAMRVWKDRFHPSPNNTAVKWGHHVALFAATHTYQPPDRVIRWAHEAPEEYYTQIGHGYQSSPEIYSGGPDFLLSAGGTTFGGGFLNLQVAEPTILLVNDEASRLSDTFYAHGPGSDYEAWNNTGVFHRLAVTAGPVHVPSQYEGKNVTNGDWDAYSLPGDESVGILSREDHSVMCVWPLPPKRLARVLAVANDHIDVREEFVYPDGHPVSFDLSASPDTWVFTSCGDRDLQSWPHVHLSCASNTGLP